MDVLIFIIPLIMTAIATFFKLKSDDATLPLYQRPTFMGIVLGLITLAYLIFGIKNLVDESIEIQTNKDKIDSLSTSVSYLKAKSDSYYDLLTVLGFKLDTTTKESIKQTDSLITIIINERKKIDTTHANADLCITDKTLTLKKENAHYVLNVDFCNYIRVIHGIKVTHVVVVERDSNFAIWNDTNDNLLFDMNEKMQFPEARNTNIIFTNNYTGAETVYFYFKGQYLDEWNRKYHFQRLAVLRPHETQCRFLMTIVLPK